MGLSQLSPFTDIQLPSRLRRPLYDIIRSNFLAHLRYLFYFIETTTVFIIIAMGNVGILGSYGKCDAILSSATVRGGRPSSEFFFPLPPIGDLGLCLGVSARSRAVLCVGYQSEVRGNLNQITHAQAGQE